MQVILLYIMACSWVGVYVPASAFCNTLWKWIAPVNTKSFQEIYRHVEHSALQQRLAICQSPPILMLSFLVSLGTMYRKNNLMHWKRRMWIQVLEYASEVQIFGLLESQDQGPQHHELPPAHFTKLTCMSVSNEERSHLRNITMEFESAHCVVSMVRHPSSVFGA